MRETIIRQLSRLHAMAISAERCGCAATSFSACRDTSLPVLESFPPAITLRAPDRILVMSNPRIQPGGTGQMPAEAAQLPWQHAAAGALQTRGGTVH